LLFASPLSLHIFCATTHSRAGMTCKAACRDQGYGVYTREKGGVDQMMQDMRLRFQEVISTPTLYNNTFCHEGASLHQHPSLPPSTYLQHGRQAQIGYATKRNTHQGTSSCSAPHGQVCGDSSPQKEMVYLIPID